jgi:hypothetical protein
MSFGLIKKDGGGEGKSGKEVFGDPHNSGTLWVRSRFA